MLAKITKDGLCIDLYELFDNVPVELQRELADALACKDAVIEHVAAQIMNGWTEFSSHGCKGTFDGDVHHSPLGTAIRNVSKASGDVAKQCIVDLEATNERVRKERDEWRGTAYKMGELYLNTDGNRGVSFVHKALDVVKGKL